MSDLTGVAEQAVVDVAAAAGLKVDANQVKLAGQLVVAAVEAVSRASWAAADRAGDEAAAKVVTVEDALNVINTPGKP